MRSRTNIIYEVFIVSIILISTVFLWEDTPATRTFNWIVWGILVLDITVRIIIAPKKVEYIIRNPFDLIAVIPLDAFFQFARFVRLLKLIRIIVLIQKTPFYKILQTNGLSKVINVMIILIFLSAIPITFIEPGIQTYGDAIWWSLVTATTVGYGDIAPVTIFGRLIAGVLMLTGIGLLGMITSSIATYFIKAKNENNTAHPTVEFIKCELNRYENLTEHDYDRLSFLVNSLKAERFPKKKSM